MKKIIENVTNGKERGFYNSINTTFKNVSISGVEDGESAFKECRDIEILDSNLYLRYPLWHCDNFRMSNVNMYDTCRASLWYSTNGTIFKSNLNGIKALRECKDITINECNIDSEEFGWKCNNIIIANTKIISKYILFDSNNCTLKNVEFTGKYSFQYNNDLSISNCKLDTKDAFWHTKNTIVKDSIVKGEYLAWYSENLTFINCTITGTQPFCYCKNLTLINCTMEGCDLAFENCSNLNVEIIGNIKSIKNPLSGTIKVDSVETIINENSVYKDNAIIYCNNKKYALK